MRGYDGIVADLLCIESVNADLRDVDNRTPLSYAAESGYDNIVQLLVKSGADTNFSGCKRSHSLVICRRARS
ncbi:hypothetical protein BDW71DRAFT_192317 [Aspergillus fruticulosus]